MIYRPPATVHCIPEKGHAISNGVQFNEPCLVLQKKMNPIYTTAARAAGILRPRGNPISFKKEFKYISGSKTW